MAEKISTVVCECDLDNGYIFKNFFTFNAIRGRPIITFTADKISAMNLTADDEICVSSYIHGSEISLTWKSTIPIERRHVSLTLDCAEIQAKFGQIRKKDQARIFVAQVCDINKQHDFSDTQSNEFAIYISRGGGGDGREGVQSIPATRVNTPLIGLKRPNLNQCTPLVIPARTFRQMIDSYSKCKKQPIKLCFYENKNVPGCRPGIMITTNVTGTGQSSGILEKYGDVPDTDDQQVAYPTANMNNLRIDESAIVRSNSSSIQLVLQEEKELAANEFMFSSDKIAILCKMASMHNEGSVRIYYQQEHNLLIAYRFGGFGECELSLHNKYVDFDK